MGMGGQRHDPAALPPGEQLGTHCTAGWVGLGQTVHPVTSCYTNYANPANFPYMYKQVLYTSDSVPSSKTSKAFL
jgi:hypothetical protein